MEDFGGALRGNSPPPHPLGLSQLSGHLISSLNASWLGYRGAGQDAFALRTVSQRTKQSLISCPCVVLRSLCYRQPPESTFQINLINSGEYEDGLASRPMCRR
jgi:hypothetical protein